MGKNTLRVAMLNAILLMGGTLACPGAVHAQSQVQTYHIEAGDLESVLSRFGTESHIQLIYPPELLKGKRSHGLTGSHSPAEALRLLLKDSGLQAERVNDKTVVIKRASAAREPQAAARGKPAAKQPDEPTVKDLGGVTVTGTRIRGGTTPSPVITIGSEQIREEGFTDLGDVIRNVTENFRGGQNPGVVNGAQSNIANQNTSGGSGLNLRGLGPDASLTLLNGRRMTYDGFGQAVDISAIPIEAVDRIEIVADGASAIYGSDAVAGVGNVILKRDFDGVTVGTRYGAATDGGLATREVTATGGTTWSTGGVIATYKHSSSDAIDSYQRDYTRNLPAPYTVYPDVDLQSGLFSIHQSIGDAVELRLDAFKTNRDNTDRRGYPGYYIIFPAKNRTFYAAPSLEITLPGDWSVSAHATTGKSEVFNGDVYVGADTVPSRFETCYCNKSRSYEVDAEGPLFPLGGGDARLAIGAGYRKNDYLYRNVVGGSAHYNGDESSRFGYAELDLPLIEADSKIPGIRRLELTAAARTEHYSSFGGVTTPKLGLIYGPSEDVTFKASWGKSFKAPTLEQEYGVQQAILYPVSSVGGSGYPADSTAIVVAGGNPALRPERAKSWTASVAFHPQALPRMEMELTWFDINFKDRVVYPIPFINFPQSMSNPIFSDFIDRSPTAEAQESILSTPLSYHQFYNYAGAAYDPGKVVAIIDDLYTNATGQRIRGLDLSGSYGIDLANGGLTFRGSLSWLDSTQQTTPAQQTYDLSGTLFNPARLNGRAGVVWTRGGLTASLFSNYTSGITDTVAIRKTSSFTTFDAVLHYAPRVDNGIWSGMDFALSAQNIFDRAPPLYTTAPPTSAPFDSTNYSAIGRFVSISASKHW